MGTGRRLAALAGRRAGSIRTTLLSQIASVLALTLFLPAGRGHWGISAVDLGLVLAVGCVGAVGYLAIYAALTAGPLALVSPIVSAYSVVVIALSLIILHEHLGAVALTGASVIIVGVALASTDLRAVRDPNALRGPGVKLALVAMVAFGVAAFGLGRYGQRFGWFLAAYVAGSAPSLWSSGAFAVAVRDRSPGRSDRWLPMAVAAGVLDIGATVSFVYGSQVGLVSLVAAASAAYPLVPVVFGMWTFGERITRAHWWGWQSWRWGWSSWPSGEAFYAPLTGTNPAGASSASRRVSPPTLRPSSSARSFRAMAARTMLPPRNRMGSGGNADPGPDGSPTRPDPDHSSSRPSASDARIRPPRYDGPTPFPE